MLHRQAWSRVSDTGFGHSFMEVLGMNRLWIAIACCAALPSVAGATDYYVSDGSSRTTSPCGSGTPCTLGYANSQAAAGDRVILKRGTYSTAIAPANSGASANSRITYMSDSLLGSNVTVTAAITLTKPYVTLKYLTLGSVKTEKDADYDSLFASTLGSLYLESSDNCMIAKNTIGGS